MNDSERDVYTRLLSDSQKRRIVAQLLDEPDGHATVDEIVNRLLEAGSGDDPDRETTRSQLAIELHHADLPKLAAHDVVSFDPDAGTVTCQNADAIAPVLESLQRPEPLQDA